MEPTEKTKNILGLQLPSDPRWAELVTADLDAILTDHAYCEQKAATSCISLIQGFPEKERLVDELSPIVTEEWGHFRLVLQELKERQLKLGNQRRDEYVHKLRDYMIKGGSRNDRLLDQLLIMALIEARSCERFKCLSEELSDEYLRKFYRRFMESEAGHYAVFIDLAYEYLPEEKVKTRWRQWLEYEAEVMENLKTDFKRIH